MQSIVEDNVLKVYQVTLGNKREIFLFMCKNWLFSGWKDLVWKHVYLSMHNALILCPLVSL